MSCSNNQAGLITIDGPSGVGKGSLSRSLAIRLDWSYMESGALYRLAALLAIENNIPVEDSDPLIKLICDWQVSFSDGRVIYMDRDVSSALRNEEVEHRSSIVAQMKPVRKAMLERQRSYWRPPGLIAEGRDMGTVVFANAPLKIYLTASLECRVERRYLQLKASGKDVRIDKLLDAVRARDDRDTKRRASPLAPAEDAITIDSTNMKPDSVCNEVFYLWEKTQNL